jgi:hypothetical protein
MSATVTGSDRGEAVAASIRRANDAPDLFTRASDVAQERRRTASSSWRSIAAIADRGGGAGLTSASAAVELEPDRRHSSAVEFAARRARGPGGGGGARPRRSSWTVVGALDPLPSWTSPATSARPGAWRWRSPRRRRWHHRPGSEHAARWLARDVVQELGQLAEARRQPRPARRRWCGRGARGRRARGPGARPRRSRWTSPRRRSASAVRVVDVASERTIDEDFAWQERLARPRPRSHASSAPASPKLELGAATVAGAWGWLVAEFAAVLATVRWTGGYPQPSRARLTFGGWAAESTAAGQAAIHSSTPCTLILPARTANSRPPCRHHPAVAQPGLSAS